MAAVVLPRPEVGGLGRDAGDLRRATFGMLITAGRGGDAWHSSHDGIPLPIVAQKRITQDFRAQDHA